MLSSVLSDWYKTEEINDFTLYFAAWLDNTFIPANQKRLRNAYKMACDALQEVGISVLPGECGLFIWVDFREVYGDLFYNTCSSINVSTACTRVMSCIKPTDQA